MNESSERHPKLLLLIFTRNCLSKTSVIRMFVYYFSLKNKQENLSVCFPWILNCFFHAFAMSKQQINKSLLVDILPTHKIFDKFWSGSREKFPLLLPTTPVRQRMFTSTNQSVDSIWPTWF